jgi:arylsulfatase A-like enzyme
MSARHLSVYGYPRHTTPNLERFAQHATVYHGHRAGGNFTAPGTASLLTGTYPWTHRAFHYAGFIKDTIVPHNLFALFGEEYFRLGYSQNPWGDLFLQQFDPAIDRHVLNGAFNLQNHLWFDNLFSNDPLIAYKAVDEFALQTDVPSGTSLIALIHKVNLALSNRVIAARYADLYPYGVPYVFNGNSDFPPFLVEDIFDGLMSLIGELPQTSALAYLHVYPPHGPCYPRKDFAEIYRDDGFQPLQKPDHPFIEPVDAESISYQRRFYDQYVALTDSEFGRLYDYLSASGILDNCYVIFTSDHGELYERGQATHLTPLLYEEIINVPLLISAPGQRERRDVFTPTSCVDVLPTLLNLAGLPSSDLTEGQLLPGFGGDANADRAVYTVEAKENSAFAPLTRMTVAMIKGQYKLIYYNYPDYQTIEFYDLKNDPEELNDLTAQQTAEMKSMRAELMAMLDQVNAPYQRG